MASITRSAAMPIAAAIHREALTRREEDAQLRLDFAAFAQRCFRELNPLTPFAMLGRVSGLVPRASARHADPLRQLCAGPRRQAGP